MDRFKPSYLRAYKEGKLREAALFLNDALSDCRLCPRTCGADRSVSGSGECRTGSLAGVSSAGPHFGEEPPLVGRHGSGTIFFTGCNLHCNFCQNFDISHQDAGEEVSHAELANMMLYLQQSGCHNINLVTPSHVVPQIISAVELAVEGGLNIPLVYNTSGYDLVETLKWLEGIVDIYMPDLKFLDGHIATRTCHAEDYPMTARKATLEMHRQVGQLKIDPQGIAQSGLLIRHLVMPGCLDDTRKVVDFIVREVSPDTFVNIMPQYRPAGEVAKTPEFNRPLAHDEYTLAIDYARRAGLHNLL